MNGRGGSAAAWWGNDEPMVARRQSRKQAGRRGLVQGPATNSSEARTETRRVSHPILISPHCWHHRLFDFIEVTSFTSSDLKNFLTAFSSETRLLAFEPRMQLVLFRTTTPRARAYSTLKLGFLRPSLVSLTARQRTSSSKFFTNENIRNETRDPYSQAWNKGPCSPTSLRNSCPPQPPSIILHEQCYRPGFREDIRAPPR